MNDKMPVMFRVKVYCPALYAWRVWRGLAWDKADAEKRACFHAEKMALSYGMGEAELCLIDVEWAEQVEE